MERRRASMCFALLALLALCVGAGPAAAQERWEPLPLWGGEVEVTEAPGSSTVYAVSSTAGLFESLDRGATWRFVSRGPNRFRMRISAVDPHDPRRLFVTTYDADSLPRGRFRSEDGGRHWSRSDAGLARFVSNLAFDPETPGTIWAATSEGLFRSVDGGSSWALHSFDGQQLSLIAFAPSDPDVVFVSVTESFPFSLLRSTDGGETFAEVLAAAPYQLVFDPLRPQRVYGLAAASIVFRSDDLGVTWASRSLSGTVLDLAVTRSGILIAGGFEPGIRRSFDGGATWEPEAGAGPLDDGALSLAVLGDVVLAGGTRGVWRSQTEGRGWRQSNTGLQAQDLVALQVTGSGAAPTVWASTGAGLFKGSRGGEAFQSLRAPLSHPGGAYVNLLAVHPRQPETAYAIGCCVDSQFFASLLKTEDGGKSWQRVPSFGGSSDLTVLEVDPIDPDIVYVGRPASHPTTCDSIRSTDGGASWICMAAFRGKDLTELAIDPSHPQRLYAVAGDELFRSANRGASWSQVPTTTKGIVRLEIDPFRSNRLYALAGNRLLRSDNGGRTWTRKLEVRQPAAMRDLLLDPERPDRIWATAELSEPGQAGKSSSRVFRSDDAGQSWQEVSGGLGAGTVILDLAASPFSADLLFAGTAGRGLFRLETGESSNQDH